MHINKHVEFHFELRPKRLGEGELWVEKRKTGKTLLAVTWGLACFPIRGRVPDPLALRRRTTASPSIAHQLLA